MNLISYFNKFEKGLWFISVVAIILSFLMGANLDYLSLVSSLIGVTALIFLAKGNVLGQVLTLLFSVLYGIISYGFSYYGEMITYLGMTAPAAIIAMVSWLKNPFKHNKSEVEIANISKKNIIKLLILAIVVSLLFYFILNYFNTSYLILSTVSVYTSFIAVGLTYYRSEFYALAYATNDLVLIILWSLATVQNSSYLTMVICFTVFFVNDLYAFYNWRKIKTRQRG